MDMAVLDKTIATSASPVVGSAVTLGPIRLMNAGLDEKGDEIIAHGWLDIEGMGLLKVGPYQREVLAKLSRKKSSLQRAVEENVRLPDIMLGMRGEHFSTKGQSMFLEDPVYIIDGLQRISALKLYAEAHPDAAKNLRIGAEVRFSTTRESEEALFLVLNTSRIPVSPNIILRNLRSQHPALASLYGLCHTDKDFPLFERVTWGQRMARGELITALILCKTALELHAFDGTAVGRGTRPTNIGSSLDARAKMIGLQMLRANVKTFFEVLDACWPLKHVEYRESCTHLKGNFLTCMARLFCEHSNFWKPGTDRLQVDAPARKKLATFPALDPEVARLASSGTMAQELLYNLMMEHFNKGKRALGRLQKRTDNR